MKSERQKILHFPLGLSYLAFNFKFTQEGLYSSPENNWTNSQDCVGKVPLNREKPADSAVCLFWI